MFVSSPVRIADSLAPFNTFNLLKEPAYPSQPIAIIIINPQSSASVVKHFAAGSVVTGIE